MSESGAEQASPVAVPRPEEIPQSVRDHDPAGLDLARQIAASVGGRTSGVRRRKPRPRLRTGVQSSGAHPDDRDPQTLARSLDGLIAERGWRTKAGVHVLLANWPRLVGPVNADHSQPEKYADGILTIRAESTTWAAQLRLFAPQLVAVINGQMGDGAVTRVVVKGPDAPSWKHGRRSVRGRGPRDTYG